MESKCGWRQAINEFLFGVFSHEEVRGLTRLWLADTFREFERDDNARVAALTGAGGN